MELLSAEGAFLRNDKVWELEPFESAARVQEEGKTAMFVGIIAVADPPRRQRPRQSVIFTRSN
jgi:hypothetical protein